MLIDVANHFYRGARSQRPVPQRFLSLFKRGRAGTNGEWVCLRIDCSKLGCPLKFEPAAAVGTIAAMPSNDIVPLFPHIYGGLGSTAVTALLRVVRSDDGQFMNIEGI
jgi:uncharacterized protein (DUF952 family)